MQILQRYPSAFLWLTVILFTLQLPFFFQAGIVETTSNLVYHFFVITWLVALFWKRFTLSPITAFKFWFVGIYPVLLVSVLAAMPLAWMFGVDNAFVAGIWVPFTEEAAKILPVFLYLWYLNRTNRWQFSLSDGLLLGFVVGFGFTFHEDAMRHGVFASGWFASPVNLLLPFINCHGSTLKLGHAGWTGLLGMATAFAFLIQGRKYARIIPLVVYLIVVLDHARCNMPAGFVSDALDSMMGHGSVVVLLFLIAVAVAFVLEGRVMAEQARRDWLFADVPLAKEWMTGSIMFKLHMLRNIIDYRRLRRAVHYRFWLWQANQQSDAVKAREMADTLRQLALAIGISVDNKYEEVLASRMPKDNS
jgi:hypothetical protein